MGGDVRGIFGCNSEILFFIILFLLLFCTGGPVLGVGENVCGC